MITGAALAVFWIAVSLVIYTGVGYPLVLFVCYGLVQVKRDWQYLHNRYDRRCPELT